MENLPGAFRTLSPCLLIGVAAVSRLAAQTPEAESRPRPSAETYLDQSLRYDQLGRFVDSIEAARTALRLQPDYDSYLTQLILCDHHGQFNELIRLKPEYPG